MRHEYPLTAQTKEVLEDNVKAIADEAQWSKNYLYEILKDEKKDPYAPFRFFFRAIARKVPLKAQVYIDDMWDMLNQSKASGQHKTVDDAFEAVSKSYIKLLTAYRTGAEIKTLAKNHGRDTNNLIQALEPQGTELTGDRKLQSVGK